MRERILKLSLTCLTHSMALVACVSAFSGCGTGSDSSKSTTDPSQDELLSSDLSGLAAYKNQGAVQFDQQSNGVFTQIFGGTTGADLTSYLNARIHYYVDKDEQLTITPSDFSINGWTQERSRIGAFSKDTSQDVSVSAVNLSIEYWIEGLVNNVMVTFEFQGQSIPITSARTGIVVLDDGYASTVPVQQEDGSMTQMAAPSVYRQAILLHEARHSDCTGGLSSAQLEKIGQAKSAADFSTQDDAGACGHLHVICPSGELEGLYACDDETYGAYGVQDVFLMATLNQYELEGDDTSEDAEIINMAQIDVSSRLLDSNASSAPDMSSTDSISP